MADDGGAAAAGGGGGSGSGGDSGSASSGGGSGGSGGSGTNSGDAGNGSSPGAAGGSTGGEGSSSAAAAAAFNDANVMPPPFNVTEARAHNNDEDRDDEDPDLDLDPTLPPDLARRWRRLSRSAPLAVHMYARNPFSRQHQTLDLDDYFTGPRDTQKHSKWPMFLQMHGSILPKMVLPLIAVGLWASLVTTVSTFTEYNLGISSILLTVTGFVVGLCLSFRSSTAYERYAEGRRYWAQLIQASQSLGRVFWVHAVERDGEQREQDILSKLTVMNLLVAFSVALKHKLRFEPYTDYDDLIHLVGHLDTYAKKATEKEPEKVHTPRPSLRKVFGEYLGLSFATSNPRRAIKQAEQPLGNMPLEIISYLACFTDELIANGQLTVPMHQTLAYNNIAVLNEVMMGTERVLTTPLPIAYSIAISQITWIYVFLLPFQLFSALAWVTIPASIVASYIILGILFIGREIENPFGQDVNDLPLESYCAQIAAELDIIASKKKHRGQDWIESLDNKVLFPLSSSGWHVWMQRGEERVREALAAKAEIGFDARKDMMGQEKGHNEGSSRFGAIVAASKRKMPPVQEGEHQPPDSAASAAACSSPSSGSDMSIQSHHPFAYTQEMV